MTDKMNEIFNIIGVKPFEKFTIKDTEGLYYFNENLFCFKVGGNSFLLTQDLEWIIGNIEPVPKSYHLSEEEREILRALDTLGFKYIARDKYNNLHTFDCDDIRDIIKNKIFWFLRKEGRRFSISQDKKELFPFIKFEDDEPYEIKEMLKWQ